MGITFRLFFFSSKKQRVVGLKPRPNDSTSKSTSRSSMSTDIWSRIRNGLSLYEGLGEITEFASSHGLTCPLFYLKPATVFWLHKVLVFKVQKTKPSKMQLHCRTCRKKFEGNRVKNCLSISVPRPRGVTRRWSRRHRCWTTRRTCSSSSEEIRIWRECFSRPFLGLKFHHNLGTIQIILSESEMTQMSHLFWFDNGPPAYAATLRRTPGLRPELQCNS